jgi:hypothetical protein
MTDRRKTITISVKDDFSAQLRQFARMVDESQGELDDFQQSMRGGGLMQGVRNVRDMTLAFNGLVTAVGQTAQAIDQFAQLGTTSRRNKAALEALSGTTAAYERNLRAVQIALRGAVTEGEAAALATQLLNLGLADSAEGIEDFTRIAATIGAMSPTIRDTEEAISQIGLTIANMSFLRLDQLGLSVADVKARMAELRSETKGMTREAAFQQAVMEGLRAKADVLGDEFTEIGGAQDRMRARFRGFKEDMAENVSVALDDAFTAAEQLSTILDELGLKETIVRVAFEITGDQEAAQTITNIVMGAASAVTGGAALTAFGMGGDDLGGGFGEGFLPSANPDVIAEALRPQLAMRFGLPPVRGSGMGGQRRGGDPLRDFAAELGIPVFDLPPSLAGIAGGLPRTLDEGAFGGRGLAGGGGAGFDAITGSIGQAAQAFGPFALGASEAESAIENLADATGDLVRETEGFVSLQDKFGIDPDSFDVDVAREMKDALRDAGVEAEIVADAMQVYNLQTGIATGASETFAGQMDTLAQELADGTISASEYVTAVQNLSQLDFTNVDRVTQALIGMGDISGAQEFIESLSGAGGLDTFDTAFAKTEELFQQLGLLGGGEGEGEAPNAFQTIIDDVEELDTAVVDTTKSMTTEAATLWEGFTTTSTENTDAFTQKAIEDFAEVQKAIEALGGKALTVSVTTTLNDDLVGGPMVGGGALPAFQEGGFTGTGSQPFMAMLHPNEVVIPLSKLPVGGAAGDGKQVIETVVVIDGREVARAVGEDRRREGKPF